MGLFRGEEGLGSIWTANGVTSFVEVAFVFAQEHEFWGYPIASHMGVMAKAPLGHIGVPGTDG